MKFLKTIRFDESDLHVFAQAAENDEWAISGAFAFANLQQADVNGKTKQAFANGFLGLESLGRSTFAHVVEMNVEDEERVTRSLAELFIADYHAPSLQEALPVAEEEIGFVRDLCEEKPINTVFTVRRTFDDNGAIREEFREITPPSGEPRHARIWEVVEDDA
ncbi:MAG: DUF6505 family protein [Hyphomicrobiales bacterium]